MYDFGCVGHVVFWMFCITEQDDEEAKDEKDGDVEGPSQKKAKKSGSTDKKVKQDTKKKAPEGGHDSDDSDSSD